MQININTIIAGKNSVKDWSTLKSSLSNYNNIRAWEKAYENFYFARVRDRYLTPIESIKSKGNHVGEGFSIMTIICSLIEFLESSYEGINYSFNKKVDSEQAQFEYKACQSLFHF